VVDGVEVPLALFGEGLSTEGVIPRRFQPVREFSVGHVKPFGQALYRRSMLGLGLHVRVHRSHRGVPATVVRFRHCRRGGSVAHGVTRRYLVP